MIKPRAVHLLASAGFLCLVSLTAFAAEPTKLDGKKPEEKKTEKPIDPLVEKVLEEEIPASPADIQRIVNEVRGLKRAMNPTDPVKTDHRVISFSLAPGQKQNQISTRAGLATTITFFDQTGAPWPIEQYVVGLQEAFSVEPAKPDGKGHLLFLTPTQPYPTSNITVVLKGLPRALSFKLTETSGDTMDQQVDVSVPMMGPQGVVPLIDRPNMMAGDNPTLLAVLSGIPPSNAANLLTGVSGLQAWTIDGMTYVRSNMEILSPAYTSRMQSADGMKAYALNDRPILWVSDNGHPVRVRLERAERVKK